MPQSKDHDAFSGCHPAVTFLYFGAVILISVFVSHPLVLGISFAGALAYAVRLKGWSKVVRTNLLFAAPAMVGAVLINPAFNHYGVTFLFYLKTGPVTLEAIVYGAVLAFMLLIAVLWFGCFNEVMTTDKFVYLFGRAAPSLSLVLSMAFRFVPRFGAQLRVIRNGRKALGRDVCSGNLLQRARYGTEILSILVTWALENAIETSDSMRARGYGLKGRTAFSIFRFDRRDAGVSLALAGLLCVCAAGASCGVFYASYNPVIEIGGFPMSGTGCMAYAAWAAFCFFPTLLDCREERIFLRLRWMSSAERSLPWYMEGRNLPWHMTEQSLPWYMTEQSLPWYMAERSLPWYMAGQEGDKTDEMY